MLPGIINHLGSDGLAHLKRLASVAAGTNRVLPSDENDIPEFENFENAMNFAEGAKVQEVNVDEAVEAQSPSEVVD